MRIENYDPELAARLNRLDAPLDADRLAGMIQAVTAALDVRQMAFVLPRYFFPVSALGMVSAVVLGLWLGGAMGNDLAFSISPAALLVQIATGGAGLV